MISLNDAFELILRKSVTLEREILKHQESFKRVTATEVCSDILLPPFDNSAMDGFAVRAADIEHANERDPVTLTLLETIGAGEVAAHAVSAGNCVKIMTGAPLPPGADAVVMRETTRQTGENIHFLSSARPGENIRRAGSDVQRGEVVIEAGTRIEAAQWAMLASLGQSEIEVHLRPRVGIIVTGDELAPLDAPLKSGQIRDSNSFALHALSQNCGADVVAIRHCGDKLDEFEAALREVAALCDVIITSGGVSAGDFDPVRDVLHALAEVHFWKIAMKPGKPLLFASFEEKLVFGLPGNPVSAMVAFEVFVRPALLKMGGRHKLKRIEVEAKAETSVRSPPDRTEFVRAVVRPENGGWVAKINGEQGSGRLSSMLNANALLVIDPATMLVRAGDMVTARLIDCPEIE